MGCPAFGREISQRVVGKVSSLLLGLLVHGVSLPPCPLCQSCIMTRLLLAAPNPELKGLFSIHGSHLRCVIIVMKKGRVECVLVGACRFLNFIHA